MIEAMKPDVREALTMIIGSLRHAWNLGTVSTTGMELILLAAATAIHRSSAVELFDHDEVATMIQLYDRMRELTLVPPPGGSGPLPSTGAGAPWWTALAEEPSVSAPSLLSA